MQTEFYRSQSDLLPTFSLVLTAAFVGLNAPHRAINPVNGVAGAQPPMSHFAYAYYGRPNEVASQPAQGAALRQFAEELLKETEDSPQGVVDILNQLFWDLV